MNLPKPTHNSESSEQTGYSHEVQTEDKTLETGTSQPDANRLRLPSLTGGAEKQLSNPNLSTNRPDPVAVAQADSPTDHTSVQNPGGPIVGDDTQGESHQVSASSNPAIADDVDVIEKEWVDKAKQIIELTKDNPHQQEREVGKLQQDYMQKRYGKKIKSAE